MKSKILITGSVTSSNYDLIEQYKTLVEICEKESNNISSPLDTMEFKGNDFDRYKRAMDMLQDTKLIIAEMSAPSTGQGMELQEAVRLDIPILIIAKYDSKISGMIKGTGKVKDILFYNEITDIEQKIIEFIKDN